MSVVYEQLKLVSCRMSFSFGGSRLSRHTHTLTCAAIQPHVTLVCRVNGLHLCIHVNAWIITHLPTPEEWKAEMALLADSSRTIYPQRSFFAIPQRVADFAQWNGDVSGWQDTLIGPILRWTTVQTWMHRDHRLERYSITDVKPVVVWPKAECVATVKSYCYTHRQPSVGRFPVWTFSLRI